MSKYLISTVETYRADTEKEAAEIISDAKQASEYELKSYKSTVKQQKQKGEIVDEWYNVSLTKIFDSEKEPMGSTKVFYGEDRESAF